MSTTPGREHHALPRRPLGTTGMDITKVGFGSWAVGGGDWAFGWGPQDDEESIAAMVRAVELGVNWIDTAAVYGLGHSEEVVARALARLPEADRPYVFTKCGLVWDPTDRHKEARRIGDPASIRAEIDASLQRLRTERVDLYQMHWPAEDGTALEDYWATLLEIQAAGKARAVALSNHGVDLLERAEALGHVGAVQPHFSAIAREAAAGVLPWCVANDSGAIVYSPMEAGLLTGAFSAERAAALDAGDWRRRNPEFSGERLAANLAFAAALEAVATRHATTTASVAVAWVLAFDGVAGAIVGARRPAQVEGWIDAGRLELEAADLDEIAAAITATGAGSGPVSPARA